MRTLESELDHAEDAFVEGLLNEKRQEYAQLQAVSEVFEHEAWPGFEAIVRDLAERTLHALASTNVDVSLVPTLRGQLKAFEHVLGLPDHIRGSRDRLLGDLQQMTTPDEEAQA